MTNILIKSLLWIALGAILGWFIMELEATNYPSPPNQIEGKDGMKWYELSYY